MRRHVWSAALLFLAALTAGSGSCRAAGALSSLLACRDIDDASARLACFDRESAALAPAGVSSGATAPPPTAATPPRSSPAPDPKQQFGLPEQEVARQEVAAGARAADVAKIQARVVGLALTSDGRTVLTLDNDQVWRQLSSDTDLFLKLGDSVTISRAFLGSYWVATPTKRGCKVTRVR